MIAGFKEIFPDENPLATREYFQGSNRDILLKTFCHIAGFRLHNSQFEKYPDVIRMWFRDDNRSFARQVSNNCLSFERKNGTFRIINPISSLTLFEQAYGLEPQVQTISDVEVEIRLFKAYLRSSQDWIERETKGIETVKQVPQDLQIAARFLISSFYKHELLNQNLMKSAISQCLKAEQLFDFLTNHNDKTKYLLSEFLMYYECKSVADYFRKIMPLYHIIFAKDKKEGDTTMRIPRHENFESICRFFDKLSLIETSEVVDDDFSKIRAFPFYKPPGEEGVYRIIYDLFVIDKFYRGLYFKLNELQNSISYPVENKFENLRSYYCDHFSEKYLMVNVLNNIANENYVKFSETEMVNQGITKGASDYYLRNENAIILFESKDDLIKKTVKQSFDYNVITTEIKEKFAKKAISQLLGNIRKIISNDWPVDKGIDLQRVKIYPVIVTHHESFNTGGLNYIINYWFKEELYKFEQNGLNISCVQPLVMIDIDTLVFYQDIFKDRTIPLEKAIQNYIDYVHLIPTQILLPNEILKRFKTESHYPFSFYFAQQVKKLSTEYLSPVAMYDFLRRLEPNSILS